MKWASRLMLFAFVFTGMLAGPSEFAASAPDDSFTITGYNVRINISDSKEYDITEVITAHFNEPRRIIYYIIPTYWRLSDFGYLSATITNFNVDGRNFDVTGDGRDILIGIGDAGTVIEGDQIYRISYHMSFGDNGRTGPDEFYCNIIYAEWDTTISGVTFSVTLPKPFDANQVRFNMGGDGSSGYNPDALTFSVNGNTITGKATKPLNRYEGLSMHLVQPQKHITGGSAAAVQTGPLMPNTDQSTNTDPLRSSITAALFVILAVGGLVVAYKLLPMDSLVYKGTHMPMIIWLNNHKNGGSAGGSR